MKRTLFTLILLISTYLLYGQTTFTIDGIKYKTTGLSTVEVTYGGSYSGNIIIPSTVTYSNTSYSVTSIGSWAIGGSPGPTSVLIPTSVTNIADYAFERCSNLITVTIPSSVTHIGNRAFSFCSCLTNINIPASVTSIGDYCFQSCLGLFSVDSKNQNYASLDGVLYNKALTTLIQYPTSKSGNFSISTTVTSIAAAAFYNCSNLTGITIPSSVSSIGDYAFTDCTGLTYIYEYSTNPVKLSDYFVFYCEHKTDWISTPLYVPRGSKTLYQSTTGWSVFSNIIEFDPSAINNPKDTNLKIFYNQATGSLQLNGMDSSASVSVYDLNGNLCLNRTMMVNEAINLKSLPRGMYMIKVVQNNEVVTRQVIL